MPVGNENSIYASVPAGTVPQAIENAVGRFRTTSDATKRLHITDFFTPCDDYNMNPKDADFGGGVSIMNFDGLNWGISLGKNGKAYIYDLALGKLGGYDRATGTAKCTLNGQDTSGCRSMYGPCTKGDAIVNHWNITKGNPIHNVPGVWSYVKAGGSLSNTPVGGYIYASPNGWSLQAWKWKPGTTTFSRVADTGSITCTFGCSKPQILETYPGDPDAALLWHNNGNLYIFRADNLQLIRTIAVAQQSKWNLPAIANGRIYVVANDGKLRIYGL
jgi:hypothetical protein